jgi:hypothetical protein
MGADCDKVAVVEGALTLDPEGIARLATHIDRVKPALVIIDPITAFIPGIDMHRANEVRSILAPLAALAADTGCAILVVRHLRKMRADRPIHSGLGSIDFTAACRSELLVGSDPHDKRQRAVAHIKCNYAEAGQTLGFNINDGVFEWTGASDLTAERLLAPSEDRKSALEIAEAFLIEMLRDGPQPATRVTDAAQLEGIAVATLRRARENLGVETSAMHVKGKRGAAKWIWRLTGGSDDQQSKARGCSSESCTYQETPDGDTMVSKG